MLSVQFILFCVLVLCYYQVAAMIVSPCKVQNMVTYPTHGTSLKSKSLVHIIQIPPVFVQSVMVGICENQNKNVSLTGAVGEFYSCQQRYSVAEVYIADASSQSAQSTTEASHNTQATPDNLYNLKFIREKVIIESGCDFTFNLLPLLANSMNEMLPTQTTSQNQKMFLRSPYHQTTPPKRKQSQLPPDNQPLGQHQNMHYSGAPTHLSDSIASQGRGNDESNAVEGGVF